MKLLLLIIFLGNALYAQNEANTWVIGNGHIIKFDSTITTSQTKKLQFGSASNATISDRKGKLLFYTDGTSIITKEHEIMKNGNDLWGHGSVIIVPYPKKENLFYVFTVSMNDTIKSYFENIDTLTLERAILTKQPIDFKNKPGQHQGKLCYHLVDMNKNKGKGEVVSKNNILYQGKAGVLADLTAIKHYNQKDFWLISHAFPKNIFRTYLINEKGLDTTTIISKTGDLYLTENYWNGPGLISYIMNHLKSSPNGKNILLFSQISTFQIFNFDNKIGTISSTNIYDNNYKYGYTSVFYTGEFSPNSQYLYIHKMETHINKIGKYYNNSTLFQYNLNLGDDIKIIKGVKKINFEDKIHSSGDMQLAKNGKVYFKTSGFKITDKKDIRNYLGCIENPNADINDIKITYKAIELPKYITHILPNITHILPPFYDSIKIGESFQRQILFDTQKAEIKMWHTPILQDIILFLNQNKNTKITIIGHTDNEGNKENNKKLSFQRAKSVADYIISQKIDKNRIKIEGLGDTKPIVENDSEENKTKNRRVEFLIE